MSDARYFFVPVAEFTGAMSNRTFVSEYEVTLDDDVAYLVLESKLPDLIRTSLFDDYTWLTAEQMRAILNTGPGEE